MAEIRLLGPVGLWIGEVEVDIGAAKQRLVFAALAAQPRQVVPIDVLADRVWGEQLPKRPAGTLYPYLSLLRSALGPAGFGIDRRSGGYVLDAPETAVDALRFRRLVMESDAAGLWAALALWRGVPLTGMDSSWAVSYRNGLLDDRLSAWLRLAERTEGLGGLADELVRVAGEYPLSEPLAGFLIRALVQAGRRAEALRSYAELRDRLIRELGEEPNDELQELHLSILRRERTPTDQSIKPVPRQIPAVTQALVGRAAELRALDESLDIAVPAVAISIIVGTAGIGKTTLALHWAHRIKDRYGGGQIFLNLHGFDPAGEPTAPAEALRVCLEAIGVRPEEVPDGLEARVAMFRSLTAERRLLVVLDNARDAAQVRPLIPSGPGCAVVVTSRNQLTGVVAEFGARPVMLDLLSAADAEKLLSERMGVRQVPAEPAAVAALARHCSGLPLALSVLAAHAALLPKLPLGELACQLTDSGSRLDRFETADPMTSVRAVLSWSRDVLDPEARRLFRLLGLHPGPDISAPAAASLAGTDRASIERALRRLCQASLLVEHVADRYACHDLLRVFAAETLSAEESPADRDAALRRLLDHYLHTAYRAIGRLNPGRDEFDLGQPCGGARPEDIADVGTALAWFTDELPVIRSTIELASATGNHVDTWRLADLTARFLGRKGRYQDAIAVEEVGLAAAQRLGDSSALAMSYRGLAYFHSRADQLTEARQHIRRSLQLYRSSGDRIGLASALETAALVLDQSGEYRAAISHLENAARIFTARGHRIRQLRCLGSIGWYQAQLGELDAAASAGREALALAGDLGDLKSVAAGHQLLGYVSNCEQNYGAAVRSYEQAVQIYRKIGDRFYAATTLQSIGDIQAEAGDNRAARTAWTDALGIFDELDHPLAEKLRTQLATHPSARRV
ncbi:BTAD domain-containing putative transcriptional regulator [Kribbella albertanoniae]|uniref:Tetratricopeptide repeat protein n=1 Tax=Kribbella albertanoniae TaxID=1266829 RepID=A0A4R4PTX7_9ACTN|nr:BTAD domain-containing putative transcriptional regulator [Kribbella albertanoniae]TDC25794.1 tetratricopeptide repeat protein [Kribbella albertanoniae]